MSANIIQLKLVLKDNRKKEKKVDEVRRVDMDLDNLNFTRLEDKLIREFDQLGYNNSNKFKVTWTDKDGDMVTIDSNKNLEIALHDMAGRNEIFRLVIDLYD
eukprot:TRINITY_DN77367_c0_g1_i1.p1 TRINITY_DN77367_c0_g1~~TRINITY_DN77367_c0_g1_i1.p1  ORF type:complete len:102 (-),score=34.27 TRINITY_DN77367_c0_g1_i1:27-332(-)